MSINVFWFLPTHGDGHYLGSSEGHARSIIVIYSKLPKRLTGLGSVVC